MNSLTNELKLTVKAFALLALPLLVIGTIFNVTVLKAFADSKKLEQGRVNRSPAVVIVHTRPLKSYVLSYLVKQ